MALIKRLSIFLIIILILALLSIYWPYITGNTVSNDSNNIDYPKEPAIILK